MVQFSMYSWLGQVFNWPRLPMQKSLPSFPPTINYDSNFWNNGARCVCVLFSRNLNLPEINLFHFKFHKAKKEAFEVTEENVLDVRLSQNSPPTDETMPRRMRRVLIAEYNENTGGYLRLSHQ